MYGLKEKLFDCVIDFRLFDLEVLFNLCFDGFDDGKVMWFVNKFFVIKFCLLKCDLLGDDDLNLWRLVVFGFLSGLLGCSVKLWFFWMELLFKLCRLNDFNILLLLKELVIEV